jgi:CheY-like chemotaxis protein
VAKLRVLVIEDNPVVTGMIRHFLERAGKLKPDLALMDVRLAGDLHKPAHEPELSSTIQLALSKYEADCRVQNKHNWLEKTVPCIADAAIARSAAVGRDLLDVYQALDCETARTTECLAVQVIREGAASRSGLAKILVARNGIETMVRETAAAIVNGAGSILGMVVVLRLEGAS